jgi:hypothetical protein
MQSLEERMNDHIDTMNKKVDELTNLVNSRLKQDDKCTAKKDLDENQKRVESKVDQIIDTVKQQKKDDMHLHDCVQQAINVKLQEDREEREEIDRRRLNIIIHGLKEPEAAEEDGKKVEDDELIISMLHQIGCDDVSVTELTRLGKKSDDRQKPRPVRLVISSEQQKNKILRQSKNLKGKKDRGWDKVFIHQDQTPKQRTIRRQLIQELKEREQKGERNLLLFNGKIVTRRKRETGQETADSDASTPTQTV